MIRKLASMLRYTYSSCLTITEVECVYCAVGAETLYYNLHEVWSLNSWGLVYSNCLSPPTPTPLLYLLQTSCADALRSAINCDRTPLHISDSYDWLTQHNEHPEPSVRFFSKHIAWIAQSNITVHSSLCSPGSHMGTCSCHWFHTSVLHWRGWPASSPS